MIRKVYLDFIAQRLQRGDLTWFFRRALQYLLIREGWRRHRPLCGPVLATLSVTYQCNYRCRMCNFHLRHQEMKAAGKPELTTQEWLKVIRDLADLGVAGVGFTGGEPLLRPDIFELLRVSHEVGLITHLNTNGYFLRGPLLERLVEARVDSVNISLDGPDAVTHDDNRGFRGAFERTVEAVRGLDRLRRERNVPLRIKVVGVLSRRNIGQAKALLQAAADLKTDCIELIPEQPFLNEREPLDPAFLAELRETVAMLQRMKKQGAALENSPRHLALFEDSFRGLPTPFPCLAGYNSIGVDNYGDIYPCMPYINWGRVVGSVREESLKEFWYKRSPGDWRDEVDRCRSCYLNCQAELNLLFQPLFRPRARATRP